MKAIKVIMILGLLTLSYRFVSNRLIDKFFVEKIVVSDTIRSSEHIVTATCYYPIISQCDSDPLVTAGMYKINPDSASEHRWVAMSRDLIKRWYGEFRYGDLVEITGAGHKDGIYKVVDTMNKRFRNRIDFLETADTKPYKFKNVKITKISWTHKNLLATL